MAQINEEALKRVLREIFVYDSEARAFPVKNDGTGTINAQITGSSTVSISNATFDVQNRLNVNSPDFKFLAASGQENGSTFHRFARLPSVTSDLQIVHPQGGLVVFPTGSSTLLVSSSSGADTFDGGAGARTISITGLNSSWQQVTEVIGISGTSVVETTGTFIRHQRSFVQTVGDYIQPGSGSNQGIISIIHSGSNNRLAVINVEDSIGSGQTETSITTVPSGTTAYMSRVYLTSDRLQANSVITFKFWRRRRADVISGDNVASRRVVHTFSHVGAEEFRFDAYEVFEEKTDLWITAVGSTGAASVEYDIFFVNNT